MWLSDGVLAYNPEALDWRERKEGGAGRNESGLAEDMIIYRQPKRQCR